MENFYILNFILIFSLFPYSAYCEQNLELDPEYNVENPKSPSQKETTNTITASDETNSKSSNSKSSTTTNLVTEANKLFLNKEYAKLNTLLWSKIELLGREHLILLVKSHYALKEYSDVVKAANLILGKSENDEEALTYIGLTYLKKNKDREAKEYFRKATDANPVYSPAIDGLVEIYEKSSNYYELRLIYQDLIKKLGQKYSYISKLCEIDTIDGVNDEAIEYCKKAIQLNTNEALNYSYLGLTYKNKNDFENAKLYLSKAANDFPKSETSQLNYARFLEEQKNFIDAFKYYDRCIKINKYTENCWIGFTTTSYQLKKFEESFLGLKNLCSFNRRHSILGRKAAAQARSSKKTEWAVKLEKLSNSCGN